MGNYSKELNILKNNILDIIKMVIAADKVDTASNLLDKYIRDFDEQTSKIDSAEKMVELYKPTINNIMSIVESSGIPDKSFRPCRKLILNEMYGCLKEILLPSLKDYNPDKYQELVESSKRARNF